MLKGKNVLLAVTGGIACYKAVDLTSRLVKAGAQVKVMMTEHAAKFVQPLLFREISHNPVALSLWNDEGEFYAEHIRLAQWADILVVAPATANALAKFAQGLADDLVSTTFLAVPSDKPIMLCPAMNCDMYANVATQANLTKLTERKNVVAVEPAEGVLACGQVGPGRLPEPQELAEHIDAVLGRKFGDFAGKHILVTAAGTREGIDPVRFIGNRSSGKMGYAIARAAISRGAEVTLVSGPSREVSPHDVHFVQVESTEEMRQACLKAYEGVDIVIKAAAVADYRPHKMAENKIKKNEDSISLDLDKNPDILKELGSLKKHQILVGFAAETQNVEEYAKKKIREKNLDLIVANDVTAPGAGFNVDTNIVKIIDPEGGTVELEQMTKEQVAHEILDKVLTLKKRE